MVGGVGQVANDWLGGQWESMSDAGVAAVQLFAGVVTGNMIELGETRRSFTGSFNGSCELLPPLRSLVTVQ